MVVEVDTVTTTTPRTDPHRPGAIVPADYDFVLSYNGATSQDGWPVPSWGINCELDRRVLDKDGKIVKNGEHNADGRCCVVGLRHVAKVRFAATGSTGACSICGTPFVYGDVWRHVPTDTYIHIGHICAAKYELLADRSAHELALGRLKAAAAVALERERGRELRAAFYAAHPGLDANLELDHHILRDLKAKLAKWRSLSEPQVALAAKIADEVRHPKPAEVHIPAPTGHGIVVRGTVVSVKTHESMYGESLKMTVKVTTPDGAWLVWGTVPSALLGGGELRGSVVEFTANLEAGREPHFVFAKRPRKARVVEAASVSEPAVA
jgi:hypothetical protein